MGRVAVLKIFNPEWTSTHPKDHSCEVSLQWDQKKEIHMSLEEHYFLDINWLGIFNIHFHQIKTPSVLKLKLHTDNSVRPVEWIGWNLKYRVPIYAWDLEHHMWWILCSLFQWVEVKGDCSLRLLMVGLLAIAV